MKLSLTVPNNNKVTTLVQPWQHGVGAVEIGEVARLADELGFSRLTVGEHFGIPDEHVDASGAHYLHSTTALAYIAGHTSRIRVASNVALLPLQHPIVQAKQWATLDWLSRGRADLIVGVGWLAKEFEALGVDFAARGRMTDEYIEAIQCLWGEESATFRGEFVSFSGIHSEPKPLQGGQVPLWFAGDVSATLRRVARWGVGWSPYQTPPAKIATSIERIKDSVDYRGQEIGVFYNLALLRLAPEHASKVDDHDFDTWNVQLLVDQIGWAASVGITEVTPPLPKLRSYSQFVERLHWLAEEVLPRVNSLPIRR